MCLLLASFSSLMLPFPPITNFVDNHNPSVLSNTVSAQLVDIDSDGLDDDGN